MDIELLEGEQIAVDNDDEQIKEMTDDEINAKYRAGDVRIVTDQGRYPLNTISSMIDSKKYKMNPEYQRRHRWSIEKRSALIESLIMNVPLPPIFLYEYDFSKYEVMDGLQRLTTISEFYNDSFELTGLTKWPELNGRKYSTLPEVVQQGIDRRYLPSIILLTETAKSALEAEQMKQMVFDRINSGGEKLTPQERRNANHDGRFNKVCISLSANEAFCSTFGIPVPEKDESQINSPRAEHPYFKEMYDVELVLRFFAYRQQGALKKGASLEKYLDTYLEKANLYSEETIDKLSNLFVETIEFAYELLGESAFYLFRESKAKQYWYWFERPTLAVYVPMMAVLSQNLDNKAKLLSSKEGVKAGLEDLYQVNYEAFGGRNVNESAWVERQRLMSEFFTRFI